MATVSEMLATALRYHQAGQLQAAEQAYRQILTGDPEHADALNWLGVISYQTGRAEEAAGYLRRAIGVYGTEAAFHNNLGNALQNQGKLEEAAECFRRAVELKPNLAAANNNLAAALKKLGRLREAAGCFRRALELSPDSAALLNDLGNVLHSLGELDEAVACYRRALQIAPQYAEIHNNLANSLKGQGEIAEAIALYRRAIEMKPDYAQAHNNLSTAFSAQGRIEEAAACCRRALEIKPDYPEALNNLGVALKNQEMLDEAIACCRRALELRPDYVEAQNNLGAALHAQGKLDAAAACYRRALELDPEFSEGHNNLGNALLELRRLDDALACYRRALQLDPNASEVHSNLGNAFKEQGKLDEAVACQRRAIELKPDSARAYNNLAAALKDQGRLDEVIVCCRRALEIKPDYAEVHSNLLYTLNFSPAYDARTILDEHLHWDRRHAAPLESSLRPHANDPSPNRRLRIGYVSPDFRLHPIGRFMLPLLESHDRGQFQIFCYASQHICDAITERCRAAADTWRDAMGLSDERLAEMVRDDRIDILVDLSMHMAKNRLLVFARKPAPVQVTYLAYCGTTGLRAMDFRLTDPHLDPLGEPARFYSEESVWLPETYWCYEPLENMPPVSGLPATASGHVTFGCLNNFCKASDAALEAWAGLLRAVDKSRLLLHAYEGSHLDRVRAIFARHDVSAERLRFVPLVSPDDYFRLYEQIDMALDPFPYGGGTTTCDALWMGVPVVTLRGETAVGRSGASILANLGMTEFVARDTFEYVRIAAGLTNDLPRLGELRAALRQRMHESPLMNAPRFARNVEAAYRQMWRRWCT